MTITMVLTGANVLLVLALLGIYFVSFFRMRSPFTLGLIIFTSLFVVQNAVALFYYLTMMPLFATGLEGFALSFAALQAIAFGILNWLAWK